MKILSGNWAERECGIVMPETNVVAKKAFSNKKRIPETVITDISGASDPYRTSLHKLISEMQDEFKIAKLSAYIEPWWWLSTIEFLYTYLDGWFGGRVFVPERSENFNEKRFKSFMFELKRIQNLSDEVQFEIMRNFKKHESKSA